MIALYSLQNAVAAQQIEFQILCQIFELQNYLNVVRQATNQVIPQGQNAVMFENSIDFDQILNGYIIP